MTFISILETIGKGFEKGLKWAVTYAVPVERLVALLFARHRSACLLVRA